MGAFERRRRKITAQGVQENGTYLLNDFFQNPILLQHV